MTERARRGRSFVRHVPKRQEMLAVAVFMESLRGTVVLQVGKYRYYKHSAYKKNEVKCLWVCKKNSVCRASVMTIGREIVTSKGAHNHD
ncbi:unnamed protein product [Pieris brassicae]|uniref:FLYWCH-type domain-containing protein n=1 Tax=Pieris brassicae TaxID=7116 RepID=A0A9P0WZQ3_PIEBR|nr:unnamed protein product [Pieris brassicae]